MTIYNENNAVVLFRGPGERIGLSTETYEIVQAAHDAAQKALQRASLAVDAASGDPDGEQYAKAREAQAAVIAEHLLIGEGVVIDNPDESRPDYTLSSVGASDLKEALQEVIGGFDLGHIGEPDQTSDHELTPRWVASTHEQLAAALADYYSCQVRPLSEVL